MLKDAIDMAKFGMGLVFFSLLLYYTIDSVNMGKNFSDDMMQGLERAQISTEKSTMDALNNMDTVMSAATAFSLMTYNVNNIRQVTCYVCDPSYGEVRTMEDNLCILTHLKGNVIVSVDYNTSYGLYDITLRAY